MSDNADLIAYLERRRQVRIRAAWYALLLLAGALVFVFGLTTLLHGLGVGAHTQTALNITAHGYHITRTEVGGVPILP